MIHISLSPNLQKDDIFVTLNQLGRFWEWKRDKHINKLKRAFSKYFNNDNIYFFNSGRSALLTFLNSLHLKEGDEVIMQSFTCNAVANPILWAGGKPVYCDIDETFNIDVKSLEKKITENTRAIIIQNTFGIPARIDEIKEIAKKYKILVIEDVAHALGATYKNKIVGTLGDVAFFSFGRDKVISSVYGGALMINNEHLKETFEREYQDIKYPNIFWTLQQLLHPLITFYVLLTYNFGGKYVLYGAQKLKLLSMAVTKKERYGKKPKYFPRLLPEPLCALALNQFEKLDKLNKHRRDLASMYENVLKNRDDVIIVENYDKGTIWLRYPIIHNDARQIFQETRERGMILGNWYREIIAPLGTSFDAIDYKMGDNKTAEYVALRILNLPTNIRTSKLEAGEVASFIKAHGWRKRFRE